ncbi:MAG: hypothetical protein H7Y86_19280 [Rhizobacter sp.]|nr:hypothetical protein [Ferruginibacter sp.]
MQRSIHIFKSHKEQEDFHTGLQKTSTVKEHFRQLLQMQEFSKKLHPCQDKTRKITIGKWIS